MKVRSLTRIKRARRRKIMAHKRRRKLARWARGR